MGEDDIEFNAHGRQFLALDQIKKAVDDPMITKSTGFYVIGVVVEKTKLITTKKGKKMVTLHLSSLEKFDTEKYKKKLQSEGRPIEEALKVVANEFRNGYKRTKFLLFNESATNAHTL